MLDKSNKTILKLYKNFQKYLRSYLLNFSNLWAYHILIMNEFVNVVSNDFLVNIYVLRHEVCYRIISWRKLYRI